MDSLTHNYATSLYGLIDRNDAIAYVETLEEIDTLLAKQSDFLRLLCSYALSFDEKVKLLDASFKETLKLPYLLDFLKVIAKHHRFPQFHEIVKDFASVVNEANHVEEGICYCAEKISDEEIARLEKALEKKLGSKVSLSQVVEPSLIGGVKVAIAGKVYDNSIKSKLASLHHSLKGGSL